MLKFSKEDQVKRYSRRKTKTPSAKISEHDLQVQCENYLKLIGLYFIRVPDAIYSSIFGNRFVHPKTKKLISSFIKGVPDLMIFKKDGEYSKCLMVELKVGKNKLSQGQLNVARQVPVHVVRDFLTFTKKVNEFNGNG